MVVTDIYGHGMSQQDVMNTLMAVPGLQGKSEVSQIIVRDFMCGVCGRIKINHIASQRLSIPTTGTRLI